MPDRDDAPSFGDAMKHASAAPAAKKDASPHEDAAPSQDKAQPPGTQAGSATHHAKAKGAKADTSDDGEATATDTTDGVAADLADLASAASQAQGQAVSADTQPAVDAKTSSSDQPSQPTVDPANGQAIAAAMLALIQQSTQPAPVATAVTMPTTAPTTTSNDSKSTIADDIGAAITASSKMAQALTGSLGGAVAGTVADAATGVIGKAVGLVGDAVAGLLGSGAKTDPDTTAQLPDPAQLATGQVSQAAVPVPVPAALQSTQVAGTPAFANELGQQIAWMSHGDIKEASIRLHPEDMGQLDVKISVHENRVDVAFAAQHPAAVQAVNQTLTQLDTMLAHHGLQLGQTQVGQQKAGQDGQGNGKSFAQVAQGGGESGDTAEVQRATVRVSNALVDDFA
ncbi:flagellar hook-length control protein FliK [Pinirhizobacter soli]|nr:flagellar hook-length control protein FliK [Pinirhizobacter soli]